MERLAELLGWTVEAVGKQWRVLSLTAGVNHFKGLLFTSLALLCTMTRVAQYDEKLSPNEIRELVRFRPKAWGTVLQKAGRIPATDEITLVQVYHRPEDEDA